MSQFKKEFEHRKIIDYILVSGDWLSDSRDIHELVKDGWQPHGGIAVAGDSTNGFKYIFAQALVKYE